MPRRKAGLFFVAKTSRVPLFSSQPSIAEWVGLVGGIIGAISALVSVATYRRDQAHVLLRVVRDMVVMMPTSQAALVRAQLKSYGTSPPPAALYYRDPDITWMTIDVVNDGRRPIKIEKVGVLANNGPSIFQDFVPKILNEGDNNRISIDQAKYDGRTILAALAVDGASRIHYGGFRRGFRGVGDRLRAWFGIPPFRR